MATGKAKWFDVKKGFGFIVPDDGGSDLFVHHTDIQVEGFRQLGEGQDVEYQAAKGKKGFCAKHVKPL